MARRSVQSPGRALLEAARHRHRRRVVLGSSLFVSHQVGELMVPVLAGLVVDRAVATGDGGSLVRWVAVLLVVFATLSTSWRLADRTISRAMEELGHELRVALADRSLAPGGIADRPTTGHVVSVAGSDVQAVMGDPEASFLWAGSVAAILAAAVVVLWASVPLGLIVLVGLPPVILLLHALTAPIERRLEAQQAEAGRAAATATDLLAGLRPLKGLRAEREASRRYRVTSRNSLVAGVRASNLLAAQQGVATVVIAVFVAVIALMGGRWAALGAGESARLTVGELIAAVGATQFLVGPLQRIAAAAAMRAAARASAERIAAVLDAPAAVPETTEAGAGDDVAAPQLLELRSVTSGRLVGLDLVVAPGELIAVAGDEPGVADDLMAVLGRWVDPDRGELVLGGVPYPDLGIRDLRRQVLVSAHDAALFDGTVRAALDPRGSSSPPTGDELAAVLVATSTDEVVSVLHDGLESHIGERGLALSGGQRQRVVLARALAVDPPILVLHDPTTAVDAVTEARIADGLRRQRSGRSTLVVSSSPALLAVADRVVHLAGGRVAAVATHDELLSTSESYRRMVTR